MPQQCRTSTAAVPEKQSPLCHHRSRDSAQGAAAADAATPKPKAQRNFTDPDSKIMLTGDGAFHQCYNAQAVVDEDHQVIVATDVNTNAADVGNLIPL